MKIRVLIATSEFLMCRGLACMLRDERDFYLVEESANGGGLFRKITLGKPDILIIDHYSRTFSLEHVKEVKKRYPSLKILSITLPQSKDNFNAAFEAGVTSYLLHECDRDEIMEALYATAKDEKFICGQIVETLLSSESTFPSQAAANASCNGLHITEREMEIIRLIAEGYSNKQIAEKLHLSTHTVTTHRKNIMNKLGVNNTAGLVLFAVRENLVSPNKFLFSS